MRWRKRRILLGAGLSFAVWLVVLSTSGPLGRPSVLPLITLSAEDVGKSEQRTTRPRPVYVDKDIPAGCGCASPSTGAVYDFCYHPHFDGQLSGRRFDCAHVEAAERLGLLSSSGFLELDRDPLPEPVFVTGSSDSHFSEQLRNIETIQQYLPSAKIVVYDLGLRKESVAKLKTLCQVSPSSVLETTANHGARL